ncbi:MAG: LolA-related protein, partial [Burkholderiales bacterium]
PVAWAFVESIRATLAGDLLQLQRFYRTDFAGSRASWRLTLLPVDEQMSAYVQSIRLSGSAQRIERVETLETGGDSSVMIITESGH